ncbi:MAG: ABC transporter permease [Clostridia bacterium]|nr:ABC transporter permease [Clostridia bacterium]
MNQPEYYVGFGLIALFIVFSIASPYFLTATNLSNVLYQVSAIGILAAGQTMVILTGGIDLSIGSVFTISGWIMCFLVQNVGLAIGLPVGLIVGLTAGLINGVLVSIVKLEPFIVTLGTMSIFNGVVYIISNSKAVSNLPLVMAQIDKFKLFGVIPSYLLILFIVLILGHLFLTYSKPGRMIYAIGSNEQAALYSGIRTQLYKIVPYVLAGGLAFVASFVQSSHLMAIDCNAGNNQNLDSITAVVIGGTSLLGGRGSLIGTSIGFLLIGVLGNGLNLLGVNSYWQRVVVGIILITTIGLQRLSFARSNK